MRKILTMALTLLVAAALLTALTSSPASASKKHTLRYQLDHAKNCAALRDDFTYILAPTIRRVHGKTMVSYYRARLVCGGEDDMHWVARKPLLHARVNRRAEVVMLGRYYAEQNTTAKRLPVLFHRQHGAFENFAVRRSSAGHFSAIVERFHP